MRKGQPTSRSAEREGYIAQVIRSAAGSDSQPATIHNISAGGIKLAVQRPPEGEPPVIRQPAVKPPEPKPAVPKPGESDPLLTDPLMPEKPPRKALIPGPPPKTPPVAPRDDGK